MKSIFVGTLFNGESEFFEHAMAIESQERVYINHHVIKNLPEHKAHKELWSDWCDNKNRFDLFVKIDADTVLNRSSALFEIASLFERKNVTGVQIKILDYFSKSLISGINAFNPEVKFKRRVNKLFPDKADYNHKTVLKGTEVSDLEPIAFHCLTPNPRQSFYYGFHRMKKRQKQILESVASIWLKDNDTGRGWALRGALCASETYVSEFFYKSSKVEKLFHQNQEIDNRVLEQFASTLLHHER